MKPFDLEKALAGNPVVTRDGRKVLKIAYFPDADDCYQLQVMVEKWVAPDGYYINGKYKDWENGYDEDQYSSEEDLFMAPKTEKLWIAIGKEKQQGPISKFYNTSRAYETKEDLLKFFTPLDSHIKEIEVEV